MSIFAKSKDGKVHLICAINEDNTICGHELSGYTIFQETGKEGSEYEEQFNKDYEWEECEHGPVTCEKCLKQIERVGIANIMEQLRTTNNDPNMVMVSAPHFDMNNFKPENLK